jgi:predicted HTH transcriptional regulator
MKFLFYSLVTFGYIFLTLSLLQHFRSYGYVKEYGEGVDRMCRELEAIGLPDPVFNNNTFILKTMEQQGIIKAITGKGKGKYILSISQEI